jgi:hypothetical protein
MSFDDEEHQIRNAVAMWRERASRRQADDAHIRLVTFEEGSCEQSLGPGVLQHVLIVTYSRFGVLKLMAERIAEGARSVPGADVHLMEVEDLPIDILRPGETQTDHILRRGC